VKKLLKKNQIIVTGLALMIALAGYLNYSDTFFKGEQTKETDGDLTNVELLDVSEEDLAVTDGEIAQLDEGETPGEAILTSGNVGNIVAQAKINREQVRAKSKESLQSIIDDEKLSEDQKSEAVSAMVTMTELAEKEVAIESLLASKGFENVVVSLNENSADVIVDGTDLTDAKIAQIEDIVVRKSGIEASEIIITPIHNETTKE